VDARPSTTGVDEAWESAQKAFGYENPIGAKDTPAKVLKLFQKMPPLFDFRESEQLALWNDFKAAGSVTPETRQLLLGHGGMFPDFDRTFLYCWIRKFKPKTIIEIGSGESTRVAATALVHASSGATRHIAIEPYRYNQVPEGVETIKSEVQVVDFALFDQLQAGDLLFIDSSHIVKPYGDTLTELIYILPRLREGVYVHIHDIFLPTDYSDRWRQRQGRVYTEQWVVALMLYGAEEEWAVVWGSKFMRIKHTAELLSMPHYPTGPGQPGPNGGSLWLRKLRGPK
jgi:hypothetical protein